MKMFLTRLGFNSKAVVTGDITQIDLPTGRRSGLVEALEVVDRIEGIGFVHFNERDVVRHNLVQQIIRAYEEFEANQTSRVYGAPSAGKGKTKGNGNGNAKPDAGGEARSDASAGAQGQPRTDVRTDAPAGDPRRAEE
jgi:phosphate starvation-inducible PhoH-like protein